MLYYYCIKPDNPQWGQPATLLGHVPGHMGIRSRQSDSLSKQLSSPIQCTLGQVRIIKLGKLFCVNRIKIFVISLFCLTGTVQFLIWVRTIVCKFLMMQCGSRNLHLNIFLFQTAAAPQASHWKWHCHSCISSKRIEFIKILEIEMNHYL